MELDEIIHYYCNNGKPGDNGNRFRLHEQIVLNDERIRRIILKNFDKIYEFEMTKGKKQRNRLYEYRANNFKVWYENKTKKSKYLSVSQIVVYLALCGYRLEYIIENENESDI